MSRSMGPVVPTGVRTGSLRIPLGRPVVPEE